MCISMHAAGLHIGEILKQRIQNVRRLIGSAGDESAEQRDVIVRHVAVGDATSLAVADMMLCKQIVLIRLKMGAIGGGRLPRPPLL